MKNLSASVIRTACLIVALGAMSGLSQTASACPMCKAALENSEDPAVLARPRAYMYSILFMLSMPATLATVFGVSFYRLSKQQQALNASLLNQFEDETLLDDDFSA